MPTSYLRYIFSIGLKPNRNFFPRIAFALRFGRGRFKYRLWLVWSWFNWKILRRPLPGTYAAIKRERIDPLDLKKWGRLPRE